MLRLLEGKSISRQPQKGELSRSTLLATGAIGGLVVGYPVSETTVYPLRQIDCVTIGESVRHMADGSLS